VRQRRRTKESTLRNKANGPGVVGVGAGFLPHERGNCRATLTRGHSKPPGKGAEAENAAAALGSLAWGWRIGLRRREPLVKLLMCSEARDLLSWDLPHIVTTPGAIPGLVHGALKDRFSLLPDLLDRLRADPALAWAFNQSPLRTRTLLVTREDKNVIDLIQLARWYPALADENRGYESIDTCKEGCDLLRLLQGGRRGVVDEQRA
jgi:hypothetical protein